MKKTTTFAIAFALVACNLSLMAAPPVQSHEWLNRVAVAIGPINVVEDVELRRELADNARLVFEEIYKNSDPRILVTRVIAPVYVKTDDPRAVAMILAKAQAFRFLSEEREGFIAVAQTSSFQAWGLIFIKARKGQVLIIIVDLEAGPRNINRS